MATKQLTARVMLNTTQAEASIHRLSAKLNGINAAANRANQTTVATGAQLAASTGRVVTATQKWNTGLQMVNARLAGHRTQLGYIYTRLLAIAGIYAGIAGAKLIIDTSDTITSAENKMNYVSAQQLGDKGFNKDGTYSTATLNATQKSLDQMYVSAQKVRMSYEDMMTYVSKSMTLAGGAFDNNTNKAIRFQEIMAEAYAVGGATAEEMSSSMGQLMQALGGNLLAGDELRSVREGAPLAYQEIEKFAQGVYDCTDSLKDMAAEGKITSDIVVGAVMQAGDKLDKAFAQTEITFAQAWTQIKNTAMRSFMPVAKMLRTALNDAIDNGLIKKAENFFTNIAKGIMIAFTVIKKVIGWIADNWNWLKQIIVGVLIVMITFMIIKTGVAIYCAVKEFKAFMHTHSAIMTNLIAIGFIIAGLLLLLYVIYMWRTGAIDTCQAIALAVIALGLIIIGVLILVGVIASGGALLIALAIVGLLALAIMFFEEVCYWAGWLAAWIVNIVFGIINFVAACLAVLITIIYNILAFIVNSIMAGAMFISTIVQWIIAFIINLIVGCAQSIVAISHNVVAAICNVGMGLFNSISAIAQNIGIAFQNAWIWAKNTFWEFIADVLRGVSKLEPVINGIAKLLGEDGVDFGGLISSAESKKSDYKSYVSVSDAWNSGMDSVDYMDVSDAWSSGWNTMEFADMGEMVSKGWNTASYDSVGDAWNAGMGMLDYVDADAWGTTAGNWGAGVEDAVNKWGSQYQTGDGLGGFSLDSIAKKLGLDFSAFDNNFPDMNDPAYDLSNPDNLNNALGGNDGLGKDVGKIKDKTGKIADSMDLTEEDLEYLRKIADMEWKKEYTTANITVDMSNYNTINGESDLDGIVTKLADKLYEEMNVVANGVYA